MSFIKIIKTQKLVILYGKEKSTSSEALVSAPAFNKHLMTSMFPTSAATCKGVAPPAFIFGLAPA
jgi:hypothetical protein